MWEMEEPNRENAKGRKREREQIARDRLRVTEWERRAGERYSPSVARDFLDCYRAASRIIPRFLCLVHSQSDHFQPQVGIPLVYYLGMPSLSTYVFEWHDGIDSRGRLKPNYGLTWPNPNWGEKVLPIMDYASNVARGKTKFTSTTPVRIADEIEFSALLALGILDQLDKQKPANNAAEFAQTLKLLRMNAYWGLYTAWKIRAAVNWALFKAVAKGGLYGDTAEQRAEECVKCLERSVQWYRKLTDIASQVYPNPARFYLSFLVSPPPWKQNDVWFSYQPVTTHWREMLPRWERELEIVREQLKLGPERAFLPLSDQLWQEPEGRVVASFDFEHDDPSLILDPATACTAAPGQAISGTRSLFLDTRGLPGEWHEGFKTDPSRVKLEPGKRYQVRVKYRVIANPGKFAQPFAVAGRSDKGGFERDVGESRSWSAPAGAYGERVIRLEPRDFTDYHVFLTVRGPAAIAIDDLTIAETPRPTARGGRFPASPTE
jgi:hypothetical protein